MGNPHIIGGRLDLTFISTSIRTLVKWYIHPTLMSDHFATVTNIETPQLPPIPPPPPRWNQELADWHIFKTEIEQWAANYAIPNNINHFEQQLIGAFHKAADKAMPKKSTGNHTFKDSWYYCQEVKRAKNQTQQSQKVA